MHRLAAPAAVLIFGAVMAGLAYGLGMGTVAQPGPGFFPFWTSAALVLTASCMIIGAARASAAERAASRQDPLFPISSTGRVAAATGAIAFLTIALEYFGLFLATFAFLALCWLAIERQPALRAILISALCALASFLLFVEVLNVHFPRGPLGL